jgi:taurine dioxygenase
MGQRVTVTPLTGTIGARVEGVELRRELPEAVADQVRQAFYDHSVLVFHHDEPVGFDEQTRLAALFGEPQPLAMFQFVGTFDPVVTLSDLKVIAKDAEVETADMTGELYGGELRNLGLGSDYDGFHTDGSGSPFLPRVAVLRSELIPPTGGDTCFSGLCAAYDRLSPLMQSWLDGLTALHLMNPGEKTAVRVREHGPEIEAAFDREFDRPFEWPVVIQQPENGRRALFTPPGYTMHVRGLKRQESNALLRFCLSQVTAPAVVYRHHWQTDDLVLWDELTVLHRAPDDYAPHPRKVHRVTAGRAVPTAPGALPAQPDVRRQVAGERSYRRIHLHRSRVHHRGARARRGRRHSGPRRERTTPWSMPGTGSCTTSCARPSRGTPHRPPACAASKRSPAAPSARRSSGWVRRTSRR